MRRPGGSDTEHVDLSSGPFTLVWLPRLCRSAFRTFPRQRIPAELLSVGHELPPLDQDALEVPCSPYPPPSPPPPARALPGTGPSQGPGTTRRPLPEPALVAAHLVAWHQVRGCVGPP